MLKKSQFFYKQILYIYNRDNKEKIICAVFQYLRRLQYVCQDRFSAAAPCLCRLWGVRHYSLSGEGTIIPEML